jgi:uncharacterized OsmC-like protein
MRGVEIMPDVVYLYHLATSKEDRDKVERAYGLHAAKCPVYRSLTPGIVITTELDWRETS